MRKILYLTGLALALGLNTSSLIAKSSEKPKDAETSFFPQPVNDQFKAFDQRINAVEKKLDEIAKEIENINKKGKFQDVSLDKSNMTKAELLDWATDTLTIIYSYDYANIDQVLAFSKRYFTEPGFNAYIKALEDSKNIQAIKDKKFIVSAVAKGPAVLLKEGVVNNIYTWSVKVPMAVTYANDAQSFVQTIEATASIVRSANPTHRMGVAIHELSTKTVK